jgi:hypothetical protein
MICIENNPKIRAWYMDDICFCWIVTAVIDDGITFNSKLLFEQYF